MGHIGGYKVKIIGPVFRKLDGPVHGALSLRLGNLGINLPSLSQVEKYPVGIDIISVTALQE